MRGHFNAVLGQHDIVGIGFLAGLVEKGPGADDFGVAVQDDGAFVGVAGPAGLRICVGQTLQDRQHKGVVPPAGALFVNVRAQFGVGFAHPLVGVDLAAHQRSGRVVGGIDGVRDIVVAQPRQGTFALFCVPGRLRVKDARHQDDQHAEQQNDLYSHGASSVS